MAQKTMLSARSRFYFYNSMGCLLKCLERKFVTVELRNNVSVRGQLQLVDASMGLTMTGVTLTDSKQRSSHFSHFYVQGRQIMFVHIPDEVDVVKAMTWQLNKINFFKEKEMQEQKKIFQRKEKMREKTRKKLEKQEMKQSQKASSPSQS